MLRKAYRRKMSNDVNVCEDALAAIERNGVVGKRTYTKRKFGAIQHEDLSNFSGHFLDVTSDGAQTTAPKTDAYKCDACEKVFKRREYLMQHKYTHGGDKPYKCPVEACGKSFARKDHLVRHEIHHTGAKQFVCDVCLKAFGRKDNLKKHEKTHS